MGFIKRHKRAVLIILALCIVAGAGFLYYLRTSKSAVAVGFRSFVKEHIYTIGLPGRPDFAKDLEVMSQTVYVDGTIYVDGAAGAMPDNLKQHDVKVLYETPGGRVFCDYATGFSVSLPENMAADLSNSPKTVSFESPGAKLVVSREWSWEEDVSAYVAYYFYRFLLDETYQAENDIELLENTKTEAYERLTVRLKNCSGKFDMYTYLTIKTGSRIFYHAMLKYASGDGDAAALPQRVLDSFSYFEPLGKAGYTTDFLPEVPENWTPETRALYEKIASSDDLMWGIFTRDVTSEGIAREIPEIEDRLDYKFDIILAYTGLGGGFPSEFMNRCDSEGRVVELTLQATERYDHNLSGRSPWLDLYKTGDDERIRAFARAARAFGKPFLFRLNNEMNSDWVSYGGVMNLLDPDIFVQNWRTVYRIFQEEGVNNAIWIYNPNDRDAPPNAWNNQAAYYPGNGYAQIFGVTGYNNGTYYQEKWSESWREFDEIYDKIEADSGELFGAFPWIITEFSSSSIGGDKAKWIDSMFKALPRYENIKAAVWFSYADYDPTNPATVSRPYWLNETDETLAAFKRGLDGK